MEVLLWESELTPKPEEHLITMPHKKAIWLGSMMRVENIFLTKKPNNGYKVKNGELTIQRIERIYKINSDGTLTKLNDSYIINNNTFTHSSLTDGDLVYVVYEYDSVETSLITDLTYYNSDKVLISPNGKAWRVKKTVDDNGDITETTEEIL